MRETRHWSLRWGCYDQDIWRLKKTISFLISQLSCAARNSKAPFLRSSLFVKVNPYVSLRRTSKLRVGDALFIDSINCDDKGNFVTVRERRRRRTKSVRRSPRCAGTRCRGVDPLEANSTGSTRAGRRLFHAGRARDACLSFADQIQLTPWKI